MYDCIVVGTGPAGATTLYHLAKAGLNVVGLEKRKVAYTKTCAGALSGLAMKNLPKDIIPLVKDIIHQVQVIYSPDISKTWDFLQPIAYMIDRNQLDEFLRQRALAQGAKILDQNQVVGMEEQDHGYRVYTKKRMYKTKTIIGADGANSFIARHAPLSKPICGLGLETSIPLTNPEWENKILIEYGQLPSGYGWAFSKGDLLSVGVANMGKHKMDLRSHLHHLLVNLKLPTTTKAKGHPIPIGISKNRQIVCPRILLVGDAASLTDPFTGEGISYALVSGKIAARHVIHGFKMNSLDFSDYQREIWDKIGANLASARKVAQAFYRFPRFTFHCLNELPDLVEEYFHMVGTSIDYRCLLSKIKTNLLPLGPCRKETMN